MYSEHRRGSVHPGRKDREPRVSCANVSTIQAQTALQNISRTVDTLVGFDPLKKTPETRLAHPLGTHVKLTERDCKVGIYLPPSEDHSLL